MSSISGCVKLDFLTFTNWLKLCVSYLRTRESWGWVSYLWRSSVSSSTRFLTPVVTPQGHQCWEIVTQRSCDHFPLCPTWAPAAIPTHLDFTDFSHAASPSQAFTWGWIKCDKWAFAQRNNCVFLRRQRAGFGQDVPDKPGLSAHPKLGFVIKNNSTSSRARSFCCC